MQMQKQIIVIPITRLKPEEHMVYGFASTGEIDTFDTRFDPEWWSQAVAGYMQKRTVSELHLDINGESIAATHREPSVVGEVPIFEIDEKGIWIGAAIRDESAWEKVMSGEYGGFSIQAMPFEGCEETVGGRDILVFTKYHLSDITIGPTPSNPDAVFQLIERLAYDDSSPWDWDWGKDADAIVAQSGWKGLNNACLYKDPDADPETKAAYKLPVAKLKNGELTIFWNGCRAAMAALNGARGGLDIPENARKNIHSKLKKLYKKFDKEITELRLDNGGRTMSKFVEKVTELVQRLTGKAPDDTTKSDIEKLESELADGKTEQINELTSNIKNLTERLDKLESDDSGDGGSDDNNGNETDELTGKVDKLQERLDALEQSFKPI